MLSKFRQFKFEFVGFFVSLSVFDKWEKHGV